MKRRFVLLLALALYGCSEPALPQATVIVGATLVNGNRPPLPNSVVVITGDSILAAGPQQTTPIPPNSKKVNGAGKFVVPDAAGSTLAAGQPANLSLLSGDPSGSHKVERRMKGGVWVDQ